MKTISFILLIVFLALGAAAQPPLSKRDQQRKAAFEAQIEAEEQYKQAIEKADLAFRNKDYVAARMTYQEAINYNPEQEQWLISKVNDLDILMARMAARQVDSIMVRVPSRQVSVLPESGGSKEMAFEDRSLETPLPRVIAVDSADDDNVEIPEPQKLEEEAAPEVNQSVSSKHIVMKPATVEKKPVEEVKVKEDFSSFRNGVTEETFTMPDHTVLRIVVKEGIDVMVFKRVKHRWGGEFYFLDDMDISKRYWTEQVEMYKQKYPQTEN